MTTKTKKKYQIEIEVKTSPRILYSYISTPNGLSDWFADDVTIQNGVYTFKWGDDEQKAKMVHHRDQKMVHFKWVDDPEDTFFEIEIVVDDMTRDTALLVTDFAEPDEIEENSMIWEKQVDNLKHKLGV
ncbi:MAG: SRPBCC domain-containing protein [Bacteroidia bacterium]|nr:SRPBCC domain-containing protein [Bacteroidia bacterium]NNC86630.1 SRPBCC domain-containing protein [Bacteroidia bacterium]NNM16461.1 SRPBCC domain-containing protein [Bacteroidia bacterium]